MARSLENLDVRNRLDTIRESRLSDPNRRIAHCFGQWQRRDVYYYITASTLRGSKLEVRWMFCVDEQFGL